MAETAEKGLIAGAYQAFIHMRDSNGYPMGQLATPDAPVDGTVYPGYNIAGFDGWVPPVPGTSQATRRARQQILGQRLLGISSLGTGTLSISDWDETFRQLIGASVVDVATHTEHAMSSSNSQNFDIPQLLLTVIGGFQNDGGTNKFLSKTYVNVQIAKVDTPVNQSDGDNPNAVQYVVTPSTSLRMPTGMLYSASGLAVQDNKDIDWSDHNSSNKGIAIDTYIDDASAPTFILTYKPVSTDATNVTNIVTKNGVSTNPTSIVTSTGVVTITPGSSGDIWVVVYPTDYVLV